MKPVSYNGKIYDIVDRKLDLSYSQIKNISKIDGLGELSDLKELNLSHNHFGEIQGLKKLNNLEKLNLGKCSIKEIKGLHTLTNLRELDLHGNYQIKGFEELKNLKNLEKLNLANCGLKEIQGLDNLINLRELNLENNYNIKGFKGLNNLKNLEKLNLSSNGIDEILDLNALVKLKYLDLSSNYIKEISLGTIKKLLELNLSNNGSLKEIKGLENLINIKKLNLNECSFSDLQVIQYLTDLRELYLYSNDVTTIKGIKNLINLEILDLDYNEITEIEELENLTNLKKIYLIWNPIPKEELKQIEIHLNKKGCLFIKSVKGKYRRILPVDYKLDLSNKGFKSIEKIEGLKELTNLKELDLSKNRISSINGLESLVNLEVLIMRDKNTTKYISFLKDPWDDVTYPKGKTIHYPEIKEIRGLDNLVNLKKLDLSEKDISEIKGLENLVNLEKLILKDNKIRVIKGLDNLKKLQKLDLKNNEIKTIKGLDNLEKLRKLYLGNNKIIKMQGLDSLSSLEILNLKGNKIDQIIYGPGAPNSNILGLEHIPGLVKIDLDREFILNKHLSVVLKDGKIDVCVDGEKFRNKSLGHYIVLEAPNEESRNYDVIESIDDVAYERYKTSDSGSSYPSNKYENFSRDRTGIDKGEIFWGHCSNLQAWMENDYDTRLLHSKISFPLLKRLAELGDTIAKKRFRNEIADRILNGNKHTLKYLAESGYIYYLNNEELNQLVKRIETSPEIKTESAVDRVALAVKILEKKKGEDSNPIQHVKEMMKKVSEGNRARRLFDLGNVIANVRINILKNFQVEIQKSENSNVELGAQIMELSIDLPNRYYKLFQVLPQLYRSMNKWDKVLKFYEKEFKGVYKLNTTCLTGILEAAFLLNRQDVIDKYMKLYSKTKKFVEDPFTLSNFLYILNRKETAEASNDALELTRNYWKKPEKEMIMSLYANMTDTYIVANEMDEVFDEIIEEIFETMEKDKSYFPALIFENIAWYYLKKKQQDKAIYYLKEAKNRGHTGFVKHKDSYFKALADNPQFLKLFDT